MSRKYVAHISLGVAAATAIGYYFYTASKAPEKVADKEPLNSAYVFIKPHANNLKTQELVKKTLAERGIKIVSEGEFTGEQIDAGMHIGKSAELPCSSSLSSSSHLHQHVL
jgi:hypothetical protein